MVKRTKEEYDAAAMLLGMHYDRVLNAFVKIPDNPRLAISWFDADTMEPLAEDDRNFRHRVFWANGVLSS